MLTKLITHKYLYIFMITFVGIYHLYIHILLIKMENTNINRSTLSDQAIVETIGAYLKQKRLEINKTQAQLALEAGLNRWTVTQIEKGEAISLVSLIQIMRALDILHLLDIFSTKEKISPLLLAKLAKKKKQRARSPINKPLQSDSSW
ncbi:hypothetical protein AQBE111736_01785 [Aquirufa beregesia]